MTFTFDYDAKGRTLDAYKLTRITDGDTPFVEMPIRMLSIDTPEVHYPGTTKPSKHDPALFELGKDLKAGKYPKLPSALAKSLADRLDGAAGTRQLTQGARSTLEYQAMLDERMKTPSGKGTRKLFLRRPVVRTEEPTAKPGALTGQATVRARLDVGVRSPSGSGGFVDITSQVMRSAHQTCDSPREGVDVLHARVQTDESKAQDVQRGPRHS